jgi:hypothetical protein
MTDEANEFLKDEEENDPIKVQKESIELQKEGIKLMKEALRKKSESSPSVVSARSYLKEVRTSSMEFQVRRIENGFILALKISAYLRPGMYQETPTEIYCQTVLELVKATVAQVEAFTKEQEVAEGTPAGGPPPFQLEPGEAV